MECTPRMRLKTRGSTRKGPGCAGPFAQFLPGNTNNRLCSELPAQSLETDQDTAQQRESHATVGHLGSMEVYCRARYASWVLSCAIVAYQTAFVNVAACP